MFDENNSTSGMEVVSNCPKISGYWSDPGNHLYVASICHCHKIGSSSGIEKPTIDHWVWDTEMLEGKMRKLISESRVIFLEVQKAFEEQHSAGQANLSNQLLRFSHQYLSAIKACSTEVQILLKHEKDEHSKEILKKQLTMMEMTELLWSLCEILFIHDTRGSFVLGELLDWMRLRFNDGDTKAQRVVGSHEREQHEFFWDSVFAFILHGRIEEARRLLVLHSKSKLEVFKKMDFLLSQMPMFTPSNIYQSFTEWSIKWQQWHITCEEHIEDEVFSDDPKLALLCEILAGRDQAFLDVSNLLGSWYCMLISKLFYQSPMIRASDLSHHTESCLRAFGGSSTMTVWDEVILAVLNLDIRHAVDECCSKFSNWWFVCHMTDLLDRKGCFESKILPFGSNLREFVTIEYASSLVSDPSLMEIGLDYFSQCFVFGRAYISELVLRSHKETDVRVHKTLRICEKYGMSEEASTICRTQGMLDLHNDLIGSALYWCIRSKDADFAAYLVKKILADNRISVEELSQLDFINNFKSSIGFSNELALLGKLTEYLDHFNKRHLREAAEVLSVIFSEKKLSKRYWPLLFDLLATLLESDEVALTKKQTSKFAECLSENEMLRSVGEWKSSKTDLPREKISKMRYKLMENLATGFLIEA